MPRGGLGEYLTVDGTYDRDDRFGAQHVQYVIGTPPQMPILRPLRQSMYSRMFVRHGTTRSMGFCYAMGQTTEVGTYATGADTNMTQVGQLGYPLEYDLMSIGIHPADSGPDYKTKWDMFLNHHPEFIWIFGGNTHWIRTAINIMEMKFPFMTAAAYNEARATIHDFPEILSAIARDVALPRIVNMTTPDRRARRISATESFRCEVNFIERAWAVGYDFSWYAVMHGILYAQL